jgi:DNA-binding PadR family transcriptional regulator
MVDEYPIGDIAKRYEVSDSVIHRQCVKLGVKRPGMAYWARKLPFKAPDCRAIFDLDGKFLRYFTELAETGGVCPDIHGLAKVLGVNGERSTHRVLRRMQREGVIAVRFVGNKNAPIARVVTILATGQQTAEPAFEGYPGKMKRAQQKAQNQRRREERKANPRKRTSKPATVKKPTRDLAEARPVQRPPANKAPGGSLGDKVKATAAASPPDRETELAMIEAFRKTKGFTRPTELLNSVDQAVRIMRGRGYVVVKGDTHGTAKLDGIDIAYEEFCTRAGITFRPGDEYGATDGLPRSTRSRRRRSSSSASRSESARVSTASM